jgi:allantoate deiminase
VSFADLAATAMARADLAATAMARADELAAFSEMEGGILRPYGSPSLARAMEMAEGWMHEAGMATARDAFGSLVGTLAGEGTGTRPFVLGGHLDSVRDAGRYDGILGVLAGIAVVEGLRQEGSRLPMPLQVIAFADEEGLRFHSTLSASRAWAGLETAEQFAYTDDAGVTMADAIRAFGGDPGAFPVPTPGILGFIEAHIEQGPVLEAEDLPVGIVTSIVASERADVLITGMAGHAGTVPMPVRHDALLAAAEVALVVERVALSRDGMVGTVGRLDIHPGASNVIPGEARMSIEVRHPDPAACREALAEIQAALQRVCDRRSTPYSWREIAGYEPTAMDDTLTAMLEDAVASSGVRPFRLPSGAGHDAINIAKIAPVSMLFVRCKDGISHNPAESVREDDVAVAIAVLADLVRRAGEGLAG